MMDSGNHFNVRRNGDEIWFSLWQDFNDKSLEIAIGTKSPLTVTMDAEAAVNLAAWLALLSDPGGREFCRMYNEIKNS